MKPVQVSIDVPQSREVVYDFLDVLSNHERFTSHFMTDWQYQGPDRGVGAKARVKATAGSRTQTVDIEVIEAERPERNVERNVSAGGRRVGTGTYLLAALPDGGTRVTFEYAWRKAPWNERLGAPIARAVLRRGNERSLQGLATELQNLKA